MSSNSILTLNQNFIQNGLGTLTFTVPATILNGPAVSNVIFGVSCQTTVQSALATGAGSGSTVANGYGAGAGGGDPVGFAQGGNGLGDGGVGQGFGAVANNYPQPIVDVIAPTIGPVVSSGLSIVVNLNGSPKYTAPAFTPTQSALQFKTNLLCNSGDTITVVFSSSTASDETLNGIQSNVGIYVGE